MGHACTEERPCEKVPRGKPSREASGEINSVGILKAMLRETKENVQAVSYTHLTLPTTGSLCRSRWSPYH